MAIRRALPRVCIALGFPDVDSLLAHASSEIDSGEQFVEFRLDYLQDPESGARAISQFLKRYPEATVLATCRRHQNQGRFNGSIEEQIRILASAAKWGASAVDIEIESAESPGAELDELQSRAALVVSYHNFSGTPALEPVLRRMMRIPADAYKIVTTARKPSDIYRILSLGKTHSRVPMILLAMGETGFPARALSAAFGSLYTYAAPSSAEGTASGQVCARMLRNLYRVEKISKNARVFGVIGDPVRHSISPAVHNRAFQARRMDAVYLPFLVHPTQLKDFFTAAEKLPVSGFSVTIPHKQKVMRYLDIIEPLARRIGAVNTVWRKGGKWRGTNTDAEGVTGPLSKKLRLNKATVLLAGNGGAARGAAFALTAAGAKLSIVGRNPDRVRALAKACDAVPLFQEQAEGMHFDALVHATPVGMWPHVDQCLFEKIPADVVFDMVYNPLETLLIRRAREENKEIVPGIHMFIEQAVRQFEIWTEDSPPRATMEKAALEALRNGPALHVGDENGTRSN
jgi:3-dehydroquinate dehydratase/shikimate dehydrogenase